MQKKSSFVNFFFLDFIFIFIPLYSAVVSLAQGYTITIDLDDMVIFLTPINCQGARIISELRRLSTVDGSAAPCSEKSVNWTWYWVENGKVWRTYNKDCSVRYRQSGKHLFKSFSVEMQRQQKFD